MSHNTALPFPGAVLGLVGDIGGTNARFALAHFDEAGRPVIGETDVLKCAEHDSLESAVEAYIAKLPLDRRPTAAVLAIAGPVVNGRAEFTNLNWKLQDRTLAQRCGFDEAHLINDFVAQALGAPFMGYQDLVQIGPVIEDVAQDLNIAILGPGTGLGVGAATPVNGQYVAIGTEGGHISFAPVDADEVALLQRLQARFGRVSLERILAGPGMVNLYHAYAEIAGTQIDTSLKPADISRRGIEGSDPIARRAVDSFCAVLGSAAGDYALAYGAWSGVFIAGGIAPSLGDYFLNSQFRTRFEAKGRFAPLLAKTPTWMITHPYPALVGAASALRRH